MNRLTAIPKDLYKGKECLIIGNGPSLVDVPLGFLGSMHSFGSNGIYMLESFVPSFYSVIGFNHVDTAIKREVIHKMIPRVKACFINRLFIQYFRGSNIKYRNVYSILSHPNFKNEVCAFSLKPLEFIGVKATITYINLQLAYWMGFHKIFLIGIDHDYTTKDRHFYFDSERPLFPTGERSIEDGELKAAQADMAYSTAKEVFEKSGRQILNLTRNWSDTSTNVFGDSSYKEYLSGRERHGNI